MKPAVFVMTLSLCLPAAAIAQESPRHPSFLAQVRALAGDAARSGGITAAQAAPADEPPPVKITGGIDFPTLYVFRGIRQVWDSRSDLGTARALQCLAPGGPCGKARSGTGLAQDES